MKHGDVVYYAVDASFLRRGRLIGIVDDLDEEAELSLVRFDDGDVCAIASDLILDGKNYKERQT